MFILNLHNALLCSLSSIDPIHEECPTANISITPTYLERLQYIMVKDKAFGESFWNSRGGRRLQREKDRELDRLLRAVRQGRGLNGPDTYRFIWEIRG